MIYDNKIFVLSVSSNGILEGEERERDREEATIDLLEPFSNEPQRMIFEQKVFLGRSQSQRKGKSQLNDDVALIEIKSEKSPLKGQMEVF